MKRIKDKFSFEEYYKHLKAYNEEHGNSYVPIRFVCEDGYELGEITHQLKSGTYRINYEQNETLVKECGLSYNYYKDKWNDSFINLYNFIINKKRLPLDNSSDKEEQAIYRWFLNQKTSIQYRYNGNNSERGEKILAIEELAGAILHSKSNKQIKKPKSNTEKIKKWDDEFRIVCDYIIGNKYIPETNAKSKQEREYANFYYNNIRRLSEEDGDRYDKIQALHEFVQQNIKTKYHTKFLSFDINRFCKKLDEVGNANIPERYVCEDGFELGKYLNGIRSGEIQISEDEKKFLIDRYGLSLNSKGYVWDKNFKDLCNFVVNEKRFPTHYSNVKSESHLSRFLNYNRSLLKTNKLNDEEKIEKLLAVEDFLVNTVGVKGHKPFISTTKDENTM